MFMHKMKKQNRGIIKPIIALMLPVFAALLAGCTPEAQQMADTLARLQETQQAIVSEMPEEDAALSQTEDAQPDTSQDAVLQDVTEEAEPADETEQSDLITQVAEEAREDLPQKGEAYYDLTNVVLYLELYHELPKNFITKDEARELGWEGGSVEDYKKGAAIGGDHFGNYEKILPKAGKGGYRECDIDTKGYKNRGSRRLIYTEDGQYYYSSDHYESFRQVLVGDDYSVELSDERLR